MVVVVGGLGCGDCRVWSIRTQSPGRWDGHHSRGVHRPARVIPAIADTGIETRTCGTRWGSKLARVQKTYVQRHKGKTGESFPPTPGENVPLVLASGSTTRARLLRAAGVSFTVKTPDLDEAALRAGMADAAEAAQHLADSKALVVSDDMPGAWVIGSDQILAAGAEMLGKPGTRDGARAQLRHLQGTTHALVTAVTLAREGHIVWQHVEQAELTMRPLTKHEIDRYLDRAGAGVLGSPGAYHLEGLGATLFETVRGDYFGILGLPLLPLLGALRQYGALVE